MAKETKAAPAKPAALAKAEKPHQMPGPQRFGAPVDSWVFHWVPIRVDFHADWEKAKEVLAAARVAIKYQTVSSVPSHTRGIYEASLYVEKADHPKAVKALDKAGIKHYKPESIYWLTPAALPEG